MKHVYLVAAIVQMVFISQTTVLAQVNTADWKEVEGSNYSTSFPNNWEVKKMGDVGVTLVAMAPLENDKDAFRENCTIVVEPVGKEIDIRTFALESSKQVLETIEDAHVSVSQMNSSKKEPYYEMIYSAKQGDLNLRYSQYFFICGGNGYIITLAGEYDKHADYEEVFDEVATLFNCNL